MIARDNCPACAQPGARLLVDLPYGSPPVSDYLRMFYQAYPQCDFQPLGAARFRLCECERCQCIFQNPAPDNAFLAQFYGQGLYGADARPGRPPPDPYQVQQIVREMMMVVRFLQPAVPRPRTLDFGTGDGQWAALAAAAGLESHATDLSDHAFAHLESRGVTCHRGDRLPPDHFDFINTEQVFEHLSDPFAQLAALRKCLRPGGVLKIGVPHDRNLRDKLRQPDWSAPKNSPASLNGVAPIEHLNHFEPASLRALAARAGLEPLTVFGWDLAAAPQSAAYLTTRSRVSRWLRARLGDAYRPHHALTQTAFFRAPPQT